MELIYLHKYSKKFPNIRKDFNIQVSKTSRASQKAMNDYITISLRHVLSKFPDIQQKYFKSRKHKKPHTKINFLELQLISKCKLKRVEKLGMKYFKPQKDTTCKLN